MPSKLEDLKSVLEELNSLVKTETVRYIIDGEKVILTGTEDASGDIFQQFGQVIYYETQEAINQNKLSDSQMEDLRDQIKDIIEVFHKRHDIIDITELNNGIVSIRADKFPAPITAALISFYTQAIKINEIEESIEKLNIARLSDKREETLKVKGKGKQENVEIEISVRKEKGKEIKKGKLLAIFDDSRIYDLTSTLSSKAKLQKFEIISNVTRKNYDAILFALLKIAKFLHEMRAREENPSIELLEKYYQGFIYLSIPKSHWGHPKFINDVNQLLNSIEPNVSVNIGKTTDKVMTSEKPKSVPKTHEDDPQEKKSPPVVEDRKVKPKHNENESVVDVNVAVENRTILRYTKACAKYITHLEKDISKEINHLSHQVLAELYQSFSNMGVERNERSK